MLALEPTPIGAGQQYRPQPAMHGACAESQGAARRRVHLELFAHGRVVIVPARIGIRSAHCRAPLFTEDPTGVVAFNRPARLGELFSVWGRRLSPVGLLGFSGRVRLYVNGTRREGDPRTLPLRDRDEVVLEVGPYVPPHRSYVFSRH